MTLQTDLTAETYDFSFTAASLRLSEMRSVAIQLASSIPFDFAANLGNGKALIPIGHRTHRPWRQRAGQL